MYHAHNALHNVKTLLENECKMGNKIHFMKTIQSKINKMMLIKTEINTRNNEAKINILRKRNASKHIVCLQ